MFIMGWRNSLLFAFQVALAMQISMASVIPPESINEDCEGFRNLLTRTLVQFSAAYFADNPRGTDTQLDPNQVFPYTPIQLFREYYGDTATPEHFKEAILQMYYSDPGLDGPDPEDSDRIILRNNIYTYAKASSFELAREKFGVLLYEGITDYAPNSVLWLNERCLEVQFISDAENVIVAELERLRNDIGEFRFGQFMDLGSGTTLAFAIDDTGSMSGEISAAKARAKQIIDERQGSLDQPQDFVLVPFNDPTFGPLTATNNPDVFKQAIDRLYAHGGGDAPELALSGILLAVENSRHGSTIFVITDIDAKDVELQDVVVAQAKQKNIKITFLLTNRIGTTMCRSFIRSDNALDNRRCLTESFKFGYELFEYIAESTGGNILVVRKSDIFRATEVIDSTVKQGVVDIVYQVLTGGDHTFPVNVDSSVREVFLQFTGDCNNVRATFNGNNLNIQNPITVGNLYEGSIPVNGRFGEWRLSLSVDATCQTKVIGRSTMGFIQTLAKATSEFPGQVLLQKFEGQPLVTDDIVFLIDAFGKETGDRVTSIDFISQSSGHVLRTFRIEDSDSNEFRVNPSTNPTIPFYMLVKGTDAQGFDFTRVSEISFQFVDVEINCVNVQDIVFRPGSLVNVEISITNRGSASATFELGATDTQRYVTEGVTPSSVTVDRGGTGTATFVARASANAIIGTTTVVTLTAKSNTFTELLYKTCRLVVGQRRRPVVESFAVDAKISSRFAETIMTSVVHNNAAVSRVAEFDILLPIDAFITQFSMTIDNVTYDGTIEERERAERIFNIARERDISASHVAARDTSSTVFRTSVNLEPFKRVSFRLTYQELLKRNQNKYTFGVSVATFQPVREFSIDVSICESSQLFNVAALGFDTDLSSIPNPIAVPGISVTQRSNSAEVTYRPSIAQQTQFSPVGLNGRFIVEYEIARNSRSSELVVDGSHFVHFASPNVEPMPKRVVFVLDASGSMFGHKINQLKIAMTDILDNLATDDAFSIIVFNSSVARWEPEGSSDALAPATSTFIEQATSFLNTITTNGGTNIYLAVESAISLLSDAVEEGRSDEPLGGTDESNVVADYIVLLTDGQSTEGITDPGQIERSIRTQNSERFGIHTIGFGTLVDARMLRRIAAQNSGTTIQIFIDIDTHIQMENFFDAIARPLLYDIEIEYPKDKVSRRSNSNFQSVFGGSELIVAGEFQREFVVENILPDRGRRVRRALTFESIPVTLRGKRRKRASTFTEEIVPVELNEICQTPEFQVTNFAERLNIFLQLKNLLREIDAAPNDTYAQELRDIALNQSLEHDFVTPGITSLVVVKPEDLGEIEKFIANTEAEASTTVATVTTASTSPPSTFDSRFGGGGVVATAFPPRSIEPTRREIIGDPHIIVDLATQITVCFNWQGVENEVYNILHDVFSGVTVNAKLIDLQHVSNEDYPTYIGEIGFIFSKQNISATIDVSTLELNVGNNNPIRLPLNRDHTTKKRGIRFRTVQISDTLCMVIITVNNHLVFKVLAHTHSTNVDIRSHLDFSVLKGKGLSRSTVGILGQFPQDTNANDAASITFIPDSNEALLFYRHNMVKVTSHSMFESYTRRNIDCWYVNKLSELTGDNEINYLVSHLLEKPKSHNVK